MIGAFKTNQNSLEKILILSGVFVFCIVLYASLILFGQNAIFYFSLAIILLILLSLFFLLTFFYPHISLVICLAIVYNPYYLYLVLTNWWEYASLRVAISSFFIFFFLITILLRGSLEGKIRRIKTALDIPLIIFLFFPALVTAYSFFRGSNSLLILADLFPFVEFIAYFFITTIIVKNLKQAKFVLKAILIWLLLVELGGIIFYFFAVQQLGYQAAPGGIVVHRLADFMAVFSLSLLAGQYFYMESKTGRLVNKKRLSILFLSFIPFLSLLLGFFRSLWIGVGGGLLFIFLMVSKNKRHLKAGFLALFLTIVILLSIDYFFIPRTQIFEGKSLLYVLSERVFNEPVESPSIRGRFEQGTFLLNEIYNSSLVGKGFGTRFGFANYYLAIAFTMGLPALFFLFGLAFIFLKSSFRIIHRLQGINKGWALGILGSFISTSLFLLFFPAILHFPIPAYLGVMAACLFFFSQREVIKNNNQ